MSGFESVPSVESGLSSDFEIEFSEHLSFRIVVCGIRSQIKLTSACKRSEYWQVLLKFHTISWTADRYMLQYLTHDDPVRHSLTHNWQRNLNFWGYQNGIADDIILPWLDTVSLGKWLQTLQSIAGSASSVFNLSNNIYRNVDNYSLNDTASYPGRLIIEFSFVLYYNWFFNRRWRQTWKSEN